MGTGFGGGIVEDEVAYKKYLELVQQIQKAGPSLTGIDPAPAEATPSWAMSSGPSMGLAYTTTPSWAYTTGTLSGTELDTATATTPSWAYTTGTFGSGGASALGATLKKIAKKAVNRDHGTVGELLFALKGLQYKIRELKGEPVN